MIITPPSLRGAPANGDLPVPAYAAGRTKAGGLRGWGAMMARFLGCEDAVADTRRNLQQPEVGKLVQLAHQFVLDSLAAYDAYPVGGGRGAGVHDNADRRAQFACGVEA